MNDQLKQLYNHLDLETLDDNLFRTAHKNEGYRRVFGGQVLAQALIAASRTVPSDRHIHSLHAYFLRPGDLDYPIIYQTDRIRDGRSFTTRRIVATQHGKAIFNMATSFQMVEDGLSHQIAMPDVPPPEDCFDRHQVADKFGEQLPERMVENLTRPFAIDLRYVEQENMFEEKVREPVKNVWIRLNEDTLADDFQFHTQILAYCSDMTLLQTLLRPHGRSVLDRTLQIASLDHAMWFHRPFKINEWVLYAQDSPSTSASRGFARGNFFTQDGELLASACQEGLIRSRAE